MFRISKSGDPAAKVMGAEAGLPPDMTLIGRFCVTDEWSGNLSKGLFQLGSLGERLHGLQSAECGLLTLLRCYCDADRIRILEVLEGASASASSFCFSTQIVSGPAECQPVLCVGHSTGFGEELDGRMHGIFVFPRMPVEPEPTGH